MLAELGVAKRQKFEMAISDGDPIYHGAFDAGEDLVHGHLIRRIDPTLLLLIAMILETAAILT